jgi:hypothetical protein
LQEFPGVTSTTPDNIKTFNEDEETLSARCIEIQYSTSVSQLQSEGNYIIEHHGRAKQLSLQKR